MGENVAIVLFLDPSFVGFSKKHRKFFPFLVKFKVVLMVFAIFCHQLYDIHVKGNFILFAMNIKVMAILGRKRLYSTLFGPQFLAFSQNALVFF